RAPKADFTYSPTTIYNDTTVSFTNASNDPDKDPLTYIWEYQAPNSTTWVSFSTTANPTKVLNSKGTWNIRLTVTDDDGKTDSIVKSIVVSNRAPKADFTYSPTTIYNDTTVSFTNASNDPDKDPLVYKWEYQAPNSTTWVSFSTAANPTKVLNSKGTWNIRLTVTDDDGKSDSILKPIVVSNRAPKADFTYSPTTIYNDTTVSFYHASNDPDKDPLTYKWEYQAPNSTTWVSFSTGANPTKILNSKGTWNIKLTVTDDDGVTDSVIKSVVVSNRAPKADFSYSPNLIYNDTVISFTNTSNDPDKDPLAYKWEYQAPNSTTWVSFSTVKDPLKVLNTKGTWNIRLTVTDDDGKSDSLVKSIVVSNRAPKADFTYSPTTIYNDTMVSFANASSDPDKDPLTYIWEYQAP
ncbi:PKD domain-containing protein, partial [Bacillus xiapuensis]|nr:PKD domain-containing protein [Bacillus xiapuensis]